MGLLEKMAATTAIQGGSKITGDSDVQITVEDQQSINNFANKNAKLHDIRSDVEKIKKDLIDLEDAENDLLLVDDENDLVPFRIGEVFVKISTDEANQLLEKQKENFQKEVEELESHAAILKKELAELKVKLYGKFGNNIN